MRNVLNEYRHSTNDCDEFRPPLVRRKRLRQLKYWLWDGCHNWQKPRSWKMKRKQQYYVDGKNRKKFTVSLKDWVQLHSLLQYFDDHKIVYNVQTQFRKVKGVRKVYEKRVSWKKIKNISPKDGRQRGYTTIYKYKKLDVPEEHVYVYKEVVGHTVTWWHTAEIDLEKILRTT